MSKNRWDRHAPSRLSPIELDLEPERASPGFFDKPGGTPTLPGDGQGFPKSRRLLKRADFQSAYSAGAKHAGAYILLFRRRRDDGEPGRIGLTATRKIGKANVRNRGKRLLREAVRRNWEIVPAGWDCVLHLLGRIRGASYAEVEADVKRLFARAAADEARRRAKLED